MLCSAGLGLPPVHLCSEIPLIFTRYDYALHGSSGEMADNNMIHNLSHSWTGFGGSGWRATCCLYQKQSDLLADICLLLVFPRCSSKPFMDSLASHWTDISSLQGRASSRKILDTSHALCMGVSHNT